MTKTVLNTINRITGCADNGGAILLILKIVFKTVYRAQ
jgi:hypothetical protein